MNWIFVLVLAGIVFGLCFLADKGFQKLFRNNAQHASGLAVRANKRTGLFGLLMILLGIVALIFSQGGAMMLICGGVILLAGAGLCAYYLSFGIFYDQDSFLCSGLFKKPRTYRFGAICSQQLYVLTGGNMLVELHMADGTTVHIQSNMDGAYLFLDAAFAGWCNQTGRNPEDCDFHDTANCCWFPKTEV